MPPLQISKFEKGLLTFVVLRSNVIVAILVAFVSVILWRWALVTVFEYFLEKKKRFEQKKITTLIDSPQGISEQKMKVVDFSSMCHIFQISLGRQGNSLLSVLWVHRPFSFVLCFLVGRISRLEKKRSYRRLSFSNRPLYMELFR